LLGSVVTATSDSDLWKKLHTAQSLIYYLQKHIFSLLCHDSASVYQRWSDSGFLLSDPILFL